MKPKFLRATSFFLIDVLLFTWNLMFPLYPPRSPPPSFCSIVCSYVAKLQLLQEVSSPSQLPMLKVAMITEPEPSRIRLRAPSSLPFVTGDEGLEKPKLKNSTILSGDSYLASKSQLTFQFLSRGFMRKAPLNCVGLGTELTNSLYEQRFHISL
jgi:hypothetical protein